MGKLWVRLGVLIVQFVSIAKVQNLLHLFNEFVLPFHAHPFAVLVVVVVVHEKATVASDLRDINRGVYQKQLLISLSLSLTDTHTHTHTHSNTFIKFKIANDHAVSKMPGGGCVQRLLPVHSGQSSLGSWRPLMMRFGPQDLAQRLPVGFMVFVFH